MRLFKKRKTKLFCFHTGTDGLKKHREFLNWVDESGAKIVNAYVLYHSHSSAHKPEYLNYVVTYKE